MDRERRGRKIEVGKIERVRSGNKRERLSERGGRERGVCVRERGGRERVEGGNKRDIHRERASREGKGVGGII